MPPNARPTLRAAGFVAAILVLALAFYPGTASAPYESNELEHRHAVVPDSAERYDEVTSEHDLDVYRYEELSPAARELFDRTRNAEDRGGPGGEREFTPTVCREFVLVCDEYAHEELPQEFTYGTELDPEESYVIVEDGDQRYLLQTGITRDVFFPRFPVGFALAWLTMLPLAGFVAVVTTTTGRERVLAGVVVGAALVAALAVLAPYLEMYGGVSAHVVGAVLLAAVWLCILGASGRGIYRRVADSR